MLLECYCLNATLTTKNYSSSLRVWFSCFLFSGLSCNNTSPPVPLSCITLSEVLLHAVLIPRWWFGDWLPRYLSQSYHVACILFFLIFSQLMQHVTSPPALTCDPVRLIEEFPKWLEKVSAKLPSGLILVFDSADRLHVRESFFWKLQSMKCFYVSRIVSHTWSGCWIRCQWTCEWSSLCKRTHALLPGGHGLHSIWPSWTPKRWRSWLVLRWPPSVVRWLRSRRDASWPTVALLAPAAPSMLWSWQVIWRGRLSFICPICQERFSSSARCSDEEAISKRIDAYLKTADCVQLYKTIFDALHQEYETSDTKGLIKKVSFSCWFMATWAFIVACELVCLCPRWGSLCGHWILLSWSCFFISSILSCSWITLLYIHVLNFLFLPCRLLPRDPSPRLWDGQKLNWDGQKYLIRRSILRFNSGTWDGPFSVKLYIYWEAKETFAINVEE